MRDLERNYYLRRNEEIVSEIRREARTGLVFKRENSVETERDSIKSSIGSFYSSIMEREVFIGLEEYTNSSAVFNTILHLGGANWHYTNFTIPTEQVSVFYGLLVDRRKNQVGMIFEDPSQGGKVPVVETVQTFDRNLRIEFQNEYTIESFPASKVVQLEAGGEKRIIDFRPLIPALVFHRDQEELGLSSILGLQNKRGLPDIDLNKKLPTVVLPRKLR